MIEVRVKETIIEASKPKMEALLTTFIEARNKERLALYDKVKARATELGVAK